MIFQLIHILTIATVSAKLGLEIELESYVVPGRDDEPAFRPGCRDDIYRTNDRWCMRTDFYTLDQRTFEFITKAFENTSEDEVERLITLKSIMKSMNGIYSGFWTKRKLNSSFWKKTHISASIEECLLSLPQSMGIDDSEPIIWRPKRQSNGFTVDTIRYSIPYAMSYVQMTVDVRPDRLFLFAKKMSQIDGLGFSTPMIRHFLDLADKHFTMLNIADPNAQSFLYLLTTYISGARFCNFPNQILHEAQGYFTFLNTGQHPGVFDFSKRFTDLTGIMARTNFADMFASLPIETQVFLHANMERILTVMLKECGGSSVLSKPLYRYGFITTSERAYTPSYRIFWALISSNTHPSISHGPIIQEWLDGFMKDGRDILSGPLYESMGAMPLTNENEWILEFRHTIASPIALPVWDEINQKVQSITYGFSNIHALFEMARFLTNSDDQTLMDVEMNMLWEQWVKASMKRLDLTDAYAEQLRQNVEECRVRYPKTQPFVELWIQRHL